jgi:hypothetical protein
MRSARSSSPSDGGIGDMVVPMAPTSHPSNRLVELPVATGSPALETASEDRAGMCCLLVT